ncbi:MAG: hypothetical protein J6U15_04145, partial [Lachnospiraceae bacterium]|nr:hypothetical protein [Lachnospiraceae bacterium]
VKEPHVTKHHGICAGIVGHVNKKLKVFVTVQILRLNMRESRIPALGNLKLCIVAKLYGIESKLVINITLPV